MVFEKRKVVFGRVLGGRTGHRPKDVVVIGED